MGGNAMKEAGAVPVLASEIPQVLAFVSELSEIPIEDLHPVGSTGKTPWSSDVDLAVDVTKYPVDKYHAILSAKLGPRAWLNFGTMVASYAIPINDKVIQVDLMFTDNLEWAKFAYWSPTALESDYKGAVRTMLLMGVAASINEDGVDYFQYDTDELIVRVGRTFDLSRGLRRIVQYRPARKNGDGWVKNMKTVTLEDLKRLIAPIPNLPETETPTVTDPRKALEIMFGRTVDPREVEDAESVLRLIRTCFDEKKQEEILIKTAMRARSATDKMKLPREITQFL
jgi:hypothetical protein